MTTTTRLYSCERRQGHGVFLCGFRGQSHRRPQSRTDLLARLLRTSGNHDSTVHRRRHERFWNSAGVDWRAFLSAKTVAPGTISEAGPQTQVAVDSAAVPTYNCGSATLTFPNTPSPGCASESTFALPGVAVGDSIAEGLPGGLPAGLVGMMRVSLANTIAVRLCNPSGGALTPPAATYVATVVKSF
jgi:hypothetical protein